MGAQYELRYYVIEDSTNVWSIWRLGLGGKKKKLGNKVNVLTVVIYSNEEEY